MLVLKEIFVYIYLAAHVVAGLMDLAFWMLVYHVRILGCAAWSVPAVCLVLAALDLSGRIDLGTAAGKTLAACALPGLCGVVDVLLRNETGGSTPPVWGCFASLLLLAGYVLLRERDREEEPLAKAEELLGRGRELWAAEAVWLALLSGAMLLMLTLGFLVTLIIGGLIAENNSLLDYGGSCGVLLGLLGIYLLRSVWLWRGASLARQTDPELDSGTSLLPLLLPVWGMIQARRLEREVRMRRRREWQI